MAQIKDIPNLGAYFRGFARAYDRAADLVDKRLLNAAKVQEEAEQAWKMVLQAREAEDAKKEAHFLGQCAVWENIEQCDWQKPR